MAVVAMRHAADERVFIRVFRQFGQKLADTDAADVCLNRRIESTGVLAARLGLRIKGVDVAGAAPEPDLNDGLRLAFLGDGGGTWSGVNAKGLHEQKPGGAIDRAAQGLAA